MVVRRNYFDRSIFTPYDFAVCALLFVLIINVALTYNSYGFTTDESVDHLRALRVVNFLLSFGSHREEISKLDDINIYGAMPDVLAVLLRAIFPALSHDARHLVSALFGVTGVFYLYRFGRTFVSPATGLFGALFLACNPMWFGYMFFNTKDIPFATTLFASLYYCLIALTGRHESRWIWLKIAVATGFFATTKLVGIPILGVIGIVTLACLAFIPKTDPIQINRTLIVCLAKIAVFAAIGCLASFAAFWPQFFLWSPAQLAGIVKLFLNYEPWHGLVLIHGNYIPFDKVPWYYTSTYIAISMPLFLLTLTAVGTVLGAIKRQPLIIAFAGACIIVLSIQAISDVRALNGYRHFIFLLPFMMLVAAYPIGCLFTWYHSQGARIATGAFVFLGIIPVLVSTYQLFPYQYSFYNAFVGSIQGADGKYYIDLWRSALREALRKLEDARHGSDVLTVYYSCGSVLNFADHPRFVAVQKVQDADYIVVLRRNCDPRSPPVLNLPVVGEVRRQGVLFATIYSYRKL